MTWEPNSELAFTEWVWEQLKVTVSIVNPFPEYITIRVMDLHQNISPLNYRTVLFPPKKKRLFQVFESQVILVYRPMGNMPHPGKFVGGSVVKYGMAEIVVRDYTPQQESDGDWLSQAKQEAETAEADRRGWIWDHTTRHLVNVKQPLIVPNFTTDGYKKMDIPAEIYGPLRNFYDLHKDELRVMEPWSPKVSSINQEEVHCSMVNLPEWLKEQIHSGLQPILEEWSGHTLESTFIYGIREYYKGNILKNHLDWLTTHVVSVILQVDKDLGEEGEDWPLEVIGFDGQRHLVYLNPGQMLMYESARLVHGRPSTFKGKYFANAFEHFKPVDWSFKITNEMIHFGDGQTEPLLPICTALTRGSQENSKQTCTKNKHNTCT